MTLAERHAGPIQLLLTDIVMPQMNGPTLAQHLVRVRPDLRVLYVSGFPLTATVSGGGLNARARFLAKPFTAATLGTAVRNCFGALTMANGVRLQADYTGASPTARKGRCSASEAMMLRTMSRSVRIPAGTCLPSRSATTMTVPTCTSQCNQRCATRSAVSERAAARTRRIVLVPSADSISGVAERKRETSESVGAA